MPDRQLTNYIKDQLQKGKTDEEIKNNLVAAGWKEQDIEEAFKEKISSSDQPPPSPPPSNTVSSTVDGKLPGPIALLKEAWEIYKKSWRTFLVIVLIPTLAQLLIWGLIAGLGISSGVFFQKTSLESNLPNAAVNVLPNFLSPGLLFFLIPLTVIIIIATIAVQFWSEAALIFAINGAGEKIGVKDSYQKGRSKIIPLFLLSLLSGLIVMGGFIFFIIPGIIFSVWFTFSRYLLVLENTGGLGALLKSREYVRGKWWPVLWRLFVLGLFNGLFYIIAAIIFPFLNLFTNLFIGPLTSVYLLLLYKHTKSIKGEMAVIAGKTKLILILAGIFGFLIIPLSIVAAIISVALNPAKQINKTQNDPVRIVNQIQIQQALNQYFLATGYYPPSLSQLAPQYLKTVPTDPKTKFPYQYILQPDGKDYQLCINFETKGRTCVNSQTLNSYKTSPPNGHAISEEEYKKLKDQARQTPMPTSTEVIRDAL
ncbi:hypothetical protein HY439_00840 [Candidatus Microgenomates bacterium]|nr:hypothetical protein [Candidatus Microgenomates bacterium]